MNNEVFNAIVADLNASDLLSDFKYLKSSSKLVLKTPEIKRVLSLEHSWVSHIFWIAIDPAFGVRFDILHKWFEKYSIRQLKDQRQDESVGFTCGMIYKTADSYYDFLKDGSDFAEKYPPFRDIVLRCAEYVFSKFNTLEDLYEYRIVPVLTGDPQVPFDQTDWVFEYLALCLLVAPENYNKLKDKLLKIMEKVRVENPRVNYSLQIYYPLFDEIFAYLESYDFSPELKQLGYK